MKVSNFIVINIVFMFFYCCNSNEGSNIDTNNETKINNKQKNNMFLWLPTTTAPESFPIEGLSATLYSSSNSSTRIPQELYCRKGWVEEGRIELMNDDVKPVPDKLVYKWLSLRERKVYLYDGEMPTALLAKYFQEGFISPIDNKKSTYQYIIFGLAPTGKICIYLSGNGVCKDVITLQAKEYNLVGEELNEFVSIYKNLDNYIELALKEDFNSNEIKPVDVNSYEATKWTNAYKKKYAWQLNIIIEKKILYLSIENYNGERLYWNNLNEFYQIESQPIPKKIEIKWLDSVRGEKNLSIITFDEEEIFKAFKLLNNKEDKIIIQPEINSKTYGIGVYIKNSKNVIQLKKCKFETR
ncbi:MAG: DUF2931 family protein [Ferruginibacter sp.]